MYFSLSFVNYESLFIFSCCTAFNASADREVGEGGLRVKILGRSGKIRIARDAGGRSRNLSRDDGVFVVEVDHVKQKNALGSDVGKKVETLANQDFSIDVNKSANYQGRLRFNLRRLNNVLNNCSSSPNGL